VLSGGDEAQLREGSLFPEAIGPDLDTISLGEQGLKPSLSIQITDQIRCLYDRLILGSWLARKRPHDAFEGPAVFSLKRKRPASAG
jgi:hypothetical protein